MRKRDRVRKRILIWSAGGGLVAFVLVVGAVFVLRIWIPYREMGETNRQTLERIHCSDGLTADRLCDVSEIVNDDSFEPAQYVLMKNTHDFLLTTALHPGFRLNVLDVDLIKTYRMPTSVVAPTGARWRLYSQSGKLAGRAVEILLGQIEDAPWAHFPREAVSEIDEVLRAEAARIVMRIEAAKGQLPPVAKLRVKTDTFAVVESLTGKVLAWNQDVAARASGAGILDRQNDFYWNADQVFLVRFDSNEDVVAVSLHPIANLWALIGLLGTISALAVLIVYVASFRWLRDYFFLKETRCLPSEEALRSRESGEVEFKEDPLDRKGQRDYTSLLKAITGFANTRDGTVCLGVNDIGQVQGLKVRDQEELNRLHESILSSVRERISPVPAFDVHFDPGAEAIVARVCVSHEEGRLFGLGGVFYIRKGVQTVPAEPEEIDRIRRGLPP